MFSFEKAVLYVARYGISRIALEEALRSGKLDAGTLPGGGWVIQAQDLETWIEGN